MSQNGPPPNSAKSNTIRANRAQTAILKAAFAVSDTVSRDALQEIATQTGLPPRWIGNWFGRERSKLRNSLGKARSTSAVAQSPVEIASVKLEFGDPASSPFSDAGVFDKSNETNATAPTPSSSSGLKTFSFVPANFQNTPHLQHPGAAAEGSLSTIEPRAEQLPYSPPATDDTNHPSTRGALAKSWNEHHFAMNIAPPKRSPMQSTARGINHSTQRRPSNLVNDVPGNIYAPFSSIGGSSAPVIDLGSKTTGRLPVSGLRAVPHDEIENVPLVPYTQTFDFTRAIGEPTFPWITNLNIAQANAFPSNDLPMNRNVVQVSNLANGPPRSVPWTNPPVHYSSVEGLIDPTKAPLKHLTELLSDFKDEDGRYLRLLATNEDAKLRKILLEDISVDEDPFLAAMALSLLAGLGFQWE